MSEPMSANDRTERNSGYAFILIFTFMALGVMLTGYLYYRAYERNFRANVESQLSSIADLKVGELVLWRSERLGDGAVLFKNPTFSALVRRFLENPEDADAERQLHTWMGKYITAYQYMQVSLFDVQGHLRVLSPEDGDLAYLEISRHIPEILREGKVVFQDFHRESADGLIHLGVAVPIYDEADEGRPLGILLLDINPATYLYPFIAKWPTPSQTGETLIVRKDGDDALFLSELRFHKNAPLNLRIPLTKTEVPAVKAALGQTGIVEGVDYRGSPVVAALLAVPGSPWAMVARMNMSEVYEPLKERLWQTLALVGFLLLGAGAAMDVVWIQRGDLYREREKAAEVLRQSESLLAEAQKVARIGHWEWDIKTGAVTWSDEMFRIHGYEPGAITPSMDSLMNSVPPEDRERMGRIIKQSLDGGRRYFMDRVAVMPDGTERIVHAEGEVERDESGAPLRMFAVVQDVTERKKAELKADSMIRRHQILMQNALEGIHILDDQGNLVEANESFCRHLGYTMAEALQLKLWDWEAKFSADELRVRIKQFLDTRGVFESVHRRKDGSLVDVEVSLVGVELDGRKYIYCTNRDITERKRAEAEIISTRNHLQATLDAIPDLLFELGLDGRYYDYHAPHPELLAAPGNSLIGRKVPDVLPPPAADVVMSALREAQEKGRALGGQFELQLPHGKLWFELSVARKTSDTGLEPRFIVLSRDITERKRGESQLKLFREALDLSSDAVLILDGDTARLVDFNPVAYKQLGYTPREMFGLTVFDIIVAEPGEFTWKDRIKQVKESGGLIVERNHRKKDGSLVPVESSLSVAEVGGKEYMVAVVRNIAERSKIHEMEVTAKSLELTNRELKEFAHVASHDMQEPLRTIIAFSDRLEAKFGAEFSPKALDYLRRIRAGGERMSNLLKDLLRYSLVSGGQLNFDRVDLNQLAVELLEDMRGNIEESGARLNVGHLPVVSADALQMRQLFQNLISNAIKYCKPGEPPEIRIYSRGIKAPLGKRNAVWEIVVEDDGIGFNNEYAEKIFKIFERLHGHSEYEGTGVGLATVRKIVERHGWTIKAEGEPGVGAKFTILVISLEA